MDRSGIGALATGYSADWQNVSRANDKEIERARYDRRAQDTLSARQAASLGVDGARAVPEELRGPYLAYERCQQAVIRPGCEVLEVCAGTGLHSLTALRCGASTTLTDISSVALDVARLRVAAEGFAVRVVVADAETLPFPSQSFDVILCAGGLSYMDRANFFRELRRLLRPQGRFIAVDSFNHNPLYRFNRWLHYRRGDRTRSTLQRMPDEAMIAELGGIFRAVEVEYFGIFTFLVPAVRRLVGSARTARWLDKMDARLPSLRRYAFKIVFQASSLQAVC